MSHTGILDKVERPLVNPPLIKSTAGEAWCSQQRHFDLDKLLRSSPKFSSVDLTRAEEPSPPGSSSLQTAKSLESTERGKEKGPRYEFNDSPDNNDSITYPRRASHPGLCAFAESPGSRSSARRWL